MKYLIVYQTLASSYKITTLDVEVEDIQWWFENVYMLGTNLICAVNVNEHPHLYEQFNPYKDLIIEDEKAYYKYIEDFDTLLTAIEEYEAIHYPIPAPTKLGAFIFKLDQNKWKVFSFIYGMLFGILLLTII